MDVVNEMPGYTPQQASALLGYDYKSRHIYKLIRAGVLDSYVSQLDGKLRISPEALAVFKDRRERKEK